VSEPKVNIGLHLKAKKNKKKQAKPQTTSKFQVCWQITSWWLIPHAHIHRLNTDTSSLGLYEMIPFSRSLNDVIHLMWQRRTDTHKQMKVSAETAAAAAARKWM